MGSTNNKLSWEGKVVWITGASSGIGRCLAVELASMGATVIASARSASRLSDLAKVSPQKILPLPLDVSDTSLVNSAREQLFRRVESIDVAILAAGVVEYERGLAFDMSSYQKVFDVNFFGVVNSISIAMPLLKKSLHKPYIVGVTSLTVVAGFPCAEIYGASKAATDYFLTSLRMDLPKEAFDISIVRPGFVKTPMSDGNDFPMPFIMTAEKAAQTIIKHMNKRKLFINFPRHFYYLLKCLSFFSLLWYRLLALKMRRS